MTDPTTELDQHLDRIRQEHPGIVAGEAAKLLPEHLRQLFWRRQIGRWLDEQGHTEKTG